MIESGRRDRRRVPVKPWGVVATNPIGATAMIRVAGPR